MRVWLALTVLSLGQVRALPAQGVWVGGGLGAVVAGSARVRGSCLTPSTAVGLLGRGGVSLRPGMQLLGTVGLHQFKSTSDCVPGPELPLPPPDGAYQRTRYTALLATRFVATDLRLRVGTPGEYQGGFGASLGIGNAWRGARDVPYGVSSVALGLRLGTVWATLEAEVYAFAVPFERMQDTWAGGQLVSHTVLERGHWIRPGATLNLLLEAPITGR